jgi:hypothetical protein
MHKSFVLALLGAAALLCASAYAQPAQDQRIKLNRNLAAADEQVRNAQGGAAPGQQTPLLDHHGPVLPLSSTLAIYWGNQADFPSDLKDAMSDLLSGFNNSSYLAIAQQYMRGAPIVTAYHGAVIDVSAPPGKAPQTSEIAAEVCKLVVQPDPNTLYIVFTSNAPHINYCAWHAGATCNGMPMQIAYVPNQALLPNCSPYTVSNLGCNQYSNGTVSSADSVAHEFMESITDPQISAWYDKRGAEIGDKCNFVYGSCVPLPNSTPGNTSWQIQKMWSNAANSCVQPADASNGTTH